MLRQLSKEAQYIVQHGSWSTFGPEKQLDADEDAGAWHSHPAVVQPGGARPTRVYTRRAAQCHARFQARCSAGMLQAVQPGQHFLTRRRFHM